MNRIDDLPVTAVPISTIEVGARRRRKVTGVERLADNIDKLGLINPILIRNGRELVAGHRRLEACKKLGWETIPARDVEHLSNDQLRALELSENQERIGYSTLEASQARLTRIQAAEASLGPKKHAALSTESVETKPSKKNVGRPPKKQVSRDELAKATGVPPSTQRDTERHVALAERYPFMNRSDKGWVMHNVLQAGSLLEALPEGDRPNTARMLDDPEIPPKTVLLILKNLTEMEASKRSEILVRAGSNDDLERRAALAWVAKQPPRADPAVPSLREALRLVEKAGENCRVLGAKDLILAVAKELRTTIDRINSPKQEEDP